MTAPANPPHSAPKPLESLPDARMTHSAVIERLFQEHNESLLRFLAARLGSRQEAHEIAQEAYVRLLKLDTPGAVSYFRAFLFKTAANLAVDRVRSRSYRERTAPLEFFERLSANVSPERELSGIQEVQLMHRLVAELPPKCQYAFIMNRLQGVEVNALAKDMGITATMVRRYISRALIHVRLGLDAATGETHETG
jgi:RNA polymerase sigma factor (sigma-70 family)